MKEIEITIPQKISSNLFYGGTHWSERKRIADMFHQEGFIAVKQQKIKPIKKYPVKFNYEFYIKGKLLDVSNLGGMVKLIEDSLVKAGILKDDSPKYVSQIIISEKKSDEKYNHCKITILDA